MIPSALVSLVLLLPASDLTPTAPSGAESGAASDAPSGQVEVARQALREHYDAVLRELRSAHPLGLEAAGRAARARTIEMLADYRERADFGVDAESVGARVPLFVDAEARRCGVATLLDGWGEQALTLRVAESANHAWVAELAGDREFEAWLERAGISFSEAVRIQAPAIGAFPRGPSTAGPSGFGPAGPSTPVAAAPATGGVSTGGVDPADWRVWWEWNKLAWMAPHRLADPAPKSDGHTVPETALERARHDLGARLAAELDHPVAQVRAAAAVAHARVAGPDAVAELLALLDDANANVRRAALLGLGATGSNAAVLELLHVAHTGSTRGSSRSAQRVVPRARALAQLSLGLARASGAGEQAVAFLADPDSGTTPTEAREVALARIYALELAGSADERARGDLDDVARDTSEIFGEDGGRRSPRARTQHPTPLRARAVEALGGAADPGTQPRLIDALGSREVELRRSAACALGASAAEDALGPLLTGFELEHDALARGLILVAIGRQGGAEARRFLEHQLASGKRSLRHWAALGLGLLAREADDDGARRVLRHAYRMEHSRSRRGAWLVAMGLARDPKAVELLSDVLEQAGDGDSRMYAGLGLGLIGDPLSAPLLRTAMAEESTPLVRSSLAQSLGLLGLPEDAERIAHVLDATSDPTIQVQLAAALGFHGSAEALDALASRLEGRGFGQQARAGVVQAVGLVLSRTAPFRLNVLAQHANPSVIPAWLLEPLTTTL